MSRQTITVEKLGADDLKQFPVWEFENDDEKGEFTVKPVRKVPVTSLTNRVVGTDVQLHNGIKVLGLLGNVSVQNQKSTQHFLTLSIFAAGKWFTLAR
jgi:hypothetical protein